MSLLSALWLCGPAFASERITIGVMDLAGKVGVSQDSADVLTDVLAAKISRMGDVNVVTKSDILSVFTGGNQTGLAECRDEACIIEEIGGALGMSWMVTGNLSRLGAEWVLNLKLIDIRNVEVPSRVTRRVSGSEDELIDELLDATHELFENVADRLPLVATVTVASRRIQLLEESPSAVSVYTREDIRSSGATDLADFLRRVPGFDIYRPKLSYPLVGTRAFASAANNHILPLIDGREALLELAGWAPWSSLSVDLEEIERVEVIRGPGSALYGANAFAGVVSITTVSHPAQRQGDIYLKAGEVGHARLFGRFRDRLEVGDGTLFFGAGMGLEGKSSPSDMRDLDTQQAFRTHAFVSYARGRELNLSLQAGLVTGDGMIYHNLGDWRLTNSMIMWLMLKSDFSLGEKTRLSLQAYYTSPRGDFFYRSRLSAYNIWIADMPEHDAISHGVDVKVKLDWQIVENLLLSSGVNLRHMYLDWNNVLPEPYDESRGAAFVQGQWRLMEELQLTGGLRLDLNTLTDTALSPRCVAVFLPWKGHSFRLGYGLAFRKPSAYETKAHIQIPTYNPATPEIVEKAKTQNGNENLKNEKVHSFEAGWRARFLDDQLRASVDLFFNLYRDTISFVIDVPYRLGLPNIPDSTFRYENKGVEANALGGEAELTWSAHAAFSLWFNVGLRYVYDKDSGSRMPAEPVFRMNLGGRYSHETGLSGDLAVHYVSKYQMPLIDPDNVFDNPKPFGLGNEVLLVGRIGYRFMPRDEYQLEAGLKIVTPLGSPFRDFPGTEIPRWSRLRHYSDWGGEYLTRIASFYMRGSF